jgi:hypothetical protein
MLFYTQICSSRKYKNAALSIRYLYYISRSEPCNIIIKNASQYIVGVLSLGLANGDLVRIDFDKIAGSSYALHYLGTQLLHRSSLN